MNAKNLPLKFGFLAVLTALCLWSIYSRGLQQGIDLKGGYSLVFEIRTPEGEIRQLTDKQGELTKELTAAKASPEANAEEIKKLEGMIRQIKDDIDRKKIGGGTESNLAERMIEILKERIDPQGLANLEWRPMGADRIEVRMPAGQADTEAKRQAYEKAREKLETDNIQRSQKRAYLEATPEKRQEMLKRLTDRQAKALQEFGDAYDAETKARAAMTAVKAGGDDKKTKEAQNAMDTARATYRERELALDATSVRATHLVSVLTNYRTPDEAAAMDKKDSAQLLAQLEQDLAAVRKAHPDRVQDIGAVVETYESWAAVRHRLGDPGELQRLIARSGVLEFRIVVGYRGVSIDRKEQEYYQTLLEKEGPEEILRRGLPYAWFPIRGSDRKAFSGLVMGQYAGRAFVLLCNQEGYKMVRERAVGGWRLTDAYRGSDNMGRLAIDFKFDEAGAKIFYNLTSSHKQQGMAITLDDEVFSAPTIQSAISDRGQITGTFSSKEIDDYVRLLQAGSLPARLNPEPIAVRSFGPSLGQENREKGIQAAYIGLIAVAAFMLIYYLVNGLIADVAMLLNVILVLGGMSLMSAVFTLPGIAGVILTMGMSVDANVLILERLREEQAKGQSIRMALKNAYERAFSAIFDSNLTTLITCVILGWVGTIEVRGFAISLGLGVAFSLFTALSVTRWTYQLLLDRKVLVRPMHMLHLFGTPNINWMSKVKWFLALSGATIVIGIISLIWQGRNILGIEFSSGTQATIQFRDDALLGADKRLLTDELVRDVFTRQAALDGLSSLRDARVELLIDRDKVSKFLGKYGSVKDGTVTRKQAEERKLNLAFFDKMDRNHDGVLDHRELEDLPPTGFQLSSTETRAKLIQDAAEKAFGTALALRSTCSFKPAGGQEVPALGLATDSEGMVRVEANPESRSRDLLEEYAGGVAIVVGDVKPPITETDLKSRIGELRSQGVGRTDIRRTEVLGLGTPTEEGYTSFAVLVKLDEVTPARWRSVALKERDLVDEALKWGQPIMVTSFDAAIAGLASQRAIMAVVLSWIAIILYLWLRFGSVRWGLAAVICLVHDTLITVGLVAASGWLYNTFLGRVLGMGDFKIDLTMIAALLTIIGYSVNDTIVVFDRIRENRGKLTTVTSSLINQSINQTLSRTVLTSTTVLLVVFIMYVWGGEGLKAFNFALLVGVSFGTYSSIAIASPLLLHFKDLMATKASGAQATVEAA
jgi:SecD/SecF fusion protein